jgi:hypothetical protein
MFGDELMVWKNIYMDLFYINMHIIWHVNQKWGFKRIFMIMYGYNECNIINLMLEVGMLNMNYMTNVLTLPQMCFKWWNVVQYVE